MLLTILEVAVGIALIIGFWNEDKLAAWEDRLFAKIKNSKN